MDDFITHVPPDAGYEIAHVFVAQRLAACTFETFEVGVILDFPNLMEPTKALRLVLAAPDVLSATRSLRETADLLEREAQARPAATRQ